MRRSSYTTLVLAVALIAIAGVLSACAGSPGDATPKAPAAAVAAPTLKLTVPADGATVPAGDLPVAVETTGLKFVMPSNTLTPGEGHVHFTLDDQPLQMSTEPEYVLKSVAAGTHTLKAELVQNDTSPFDPPVEQVITFTAK